MTQPQQQGGQSSSASDPNAVPLDAEAKQLKLDQQKAQARQAIAEARQAELKASLPSPATKPLEGTVILGDKAGYMAELAAYAVLDHAADQITADAAAAINSAPLPAPAAVGLDKNAPPPQPRLDGQSILLVSDPALVASDWPYRVVNDQLLRLNDAVAGAATAVAGAATAVAGLVAPSKPEPERRPAAEKLVGAPPAAAAASAVPAYVGAVADVIGLFRTDYTITGRDVVLQPPALLAAAARRLRGLGANVIVDGFTLLSSGSVLDRFDQLRRGRDDLLVAITKLDKTVIAPEQAELDRRVALLAEQAAAYDKQRDTGKEDTAIKQRVDELQAQVDEQTIATAGPAAASAQAHTVLDAVDAFVAAVTAAPQTGYPPLVAAAIRERLHATDETRISHVLCLTIGSAGGDTITRKSLFRASGIVGYVGGCQITHLMLDTAQGFLVTSGSQALTATLRYDLKSNRVTDRHISSEERLPRLSTG